MIRELNFLLSSAKVSIDVETSGLNPLIHELLIITIKSENNIYFFRPSDHFHMNKLREICMNNNIIKIFHYAAFDISFLLKYGIRFSSVWCTKVAEKIIDNNTRYSLKDLVQKYMNISLEKNLQLSNWANSLNTQQINYIKNDVQYLEDIMIIQSRNLAELGRFDLAIGAMQMVPFIGELRSRGLDANIFSY